MTGEPSTQCFLQQPVEWQLLQAQIPGDSRPGQHSGDLPVTQTNWERVPRGILGRPVMDYGLSHVSSYPPHPNVNQLHGLQPTRDDSFLRVESTLKGTMVNGFIRGWLGEVMGIEYPCKMEGTRGLGFQISSIILFYFLTQQYNSFQVSGPTPVHMCGRGSSHGQHQAILKHHRVSENSAQSWCYLPRDGTRFPKLRALS